MEWLLLSLTFSFSLDNTVSTLTPGTTRFKEFRGHSLGGKRAEALRMTTQFYSAPRVKIRGYISTPVAGRQSTLLTYRGCKSISILVPRLYPSQANISAFRCLVSGESSSEVQIIPFLFESYTVRILH